MMIKCLFMILMLITVAISAQASTDLGSHCWDATPFDDQLRLWAVVATDPDLTMIGFPAGFWQGPGAYQLNVVGGSVNPSYPIPGTLSLSVRLDNASSFFGNRPNCRLRAELDPETFNGSWSMRCTNPEAAGVFSVGGFLTYVGCGSPPPSEVQFQRSFGSSLAGNAPQ